MNKDEIKRGLECCAGNIDWLDCNDCPYFKHHCGRGNKLMQDALNLITEQEKEIEKQNSRVKTLKNRLNEKYALISNMETEYEKAFELLNAQRREIDQLKADNKQGNVLKVFGNNVTTSTK